MPGANRPERDEKKCDREVITLEEFKDWLGKP